MSFVRISVGAAVSMNLVSARMSRIAVGSFDNKVCLFGEDKLVSLGAIARSAVFKITAYSCALFLPKFS